MSDPKAVYTPGPWQWNGTYLEHQQDGGGYVLAWFYDRWDDYGELDACDEDKRLIAAAPDLYEALRRIVGAIQYEATQPPPFNQSDVSATCRVLMNTVNMYDALAALRKAGGSDSL